MSKATSPTTTTSPTAPPSPSILQLMAKSPSLLLQRVTSGSRSFSSSNNSKARALTKADKTTRTSLYFYRQFYEGVLPQLQSRVPEETDTDYLIELLAEWQGNIDTAQKKYHETREWRKTYLPVPIEEVQPSIGTGKFLFHGYDKVGRGVIYYRVKLHDPKKFTPQETLRHAVFNYELMLAKMAKEGRSIKECLVVVDRTGAGRKNTDVEFLKCFYQVFKDHYPARGEVFLIYGVNFIFRGVWAIVKPFLDVKSQGCTFMLNSKDELRDFIDDDQLPDFLRGGASGADGASVYSPGATPTSGDALSTKSVKVEGVSG